MARLIALTTDVVTLYGALGKPSNAPLELIVVGARVRFLREALPTRITLTLRDQRQREGRPAFSLNPCIPYEIIRRNDRES